MGRKYYRPEQIILKLPEAEIQLAKGLRPSRIKPGLMQASSAVSEKGG